MWEKIVLNLLSNAFKFTFEGEIEVALRPDAAMRSSWPCATPASASRRRRCRGCSSGSTASKGCERRTHEGTGIGLALVQELVRLHGGEIAVESALGRARRSPSRSRPARRTCQPTGSARRAARPRPRSGAPRSWTRRCGWLTDDAVVAGERPPTLAAWPPAPMPRSFLRRGRLRPPPVAPPADRPGRASWWPTTTPTCATTWSALLSPALHGRGGGGRRAGTGGHHARTRRT